MSGPQPGTVGNTLSTLTLIAIIYSISALNDFRETMAAHQHNIAVISANQRVHAEKLSNHDRRIARVESEKWAIKQQ